VEFSLKDQLQASDLSPTVATVEPVSYFTDDLRETIKLWFEFALS
jgi:hypothetical protein